MGNAAKKAPKDDEEERDPTDDEEEVDGEGDDEDEDDDDGDDEDEEDDPEDEDEETALAKDICQALRDALESQVSTVVERKRILLDLDDDSHWVLTLKRRD